MPIDVAGLIEERRAEKFTLFDRHLNAQLVRVLRTLGFAVDYVRAEGAYLFDAEGNRYLDLLSGFGVFALGRNHPTVVAALEQVLRGRLAGLVQLDVSLLAALLAERLTGYMPWLGSCSFAAPAPRRSRPRSSSAGRRPAAPGSCIASMPSTA
jgi:ornithine--oxo-acid transaminase